MTNIVDKVSIALKPAVPICHVSIEYVFCVADSVTNLHYDISPYKNITGIEIVSFTDSYSLKKALYTI